MITSPHPEPQLQQESRQKILDAAEILFAAQGFEATSMRAITAEAGVNLASVNYYFRSKDNLIAEVLCRAIRPLNKQRLALLQQEIDHYQTAPIPLPKILNALLRPCLEISFDPSRQKVFQLLGRSLSEEGNFIEEVIEKEWEPMLGVFMTSLQQSVPDVSQEDIYWRIHFTCGAMIHSSCHHKELTKLSSGLCKMDFESTLKRLIDFAAAGIVVKS